MTAKTFIIDDCFLVGCEGKQCDVSGSLDRAGKCSLMLGAGSGNSSRKDLASLSDELSQLRNILIIDVIYMIDTELANFTSGASGTEASFEIAASSLSLAASVA